MEHMADPPQRPVRLPRGDESPAPAPAPGAGAELLQRLTDVLDEVAAAPAVLHQLSEDQLTQLGQAGLAMTRKGESLLVAVTAEAISRGVVTESVAANAYQWVQWLGPGVEPSQARRISAVAEEIAMSPGLVPFVRVDPEGDQEGDDAADDPQSAAADGDDVDPLVLSDPTGRALLAEVVSGDVVSVRAAASALREEPKITPLLPTASRAEVLSWFLALGDDATDADRRSLTKQLIGRYDPEQLDRSEEAAQRAESLTMYELPSGLVRLVAELSPGNAAIVAQAIGHLSAPDPMRCPAPNPGESAPAGRAAGAGRPEGSGGGGPTRQNVSHPAHPRSTEAPGGAPGEHPPGGARGDSPPAGVPGESPPQDVAGEPPPEGASAESPPGVPPDEPLAPGGARQESIAIAAAPEKTAPARDPRSAPKRRADAFMELVQRAAAVLPGAAKGSVTSHPKVVVTVGLETLQGVPGPFEGSSVGVRCLPGTGRTQAGELLAGSVLRRLACDAGVIPAVLGSHGGVIDLGQEERLFVGRARTAVVQRDRCCTFPGCDRPPDWCEVHHLVPWWAGGPTDVDNGALLCTRHHTIVHRDGLLGEVVDGRVVWDLTRGRLDRLAPMLRPRTTPPRRAG